MKIKQMFISVLMVIVLGGFANAQMCGKIKEVSGGEDHSLALMEVL
jgi:hypothetical protein